MSTMDVTTHDKLEQMLREGKISEEDFERLASAAERSPATPQESEEDAKATRREFRRVREGAVVSGVCAGLAKRFGWDLGLLRAGAVILTLLLAALAGAGLLIPLSYLIVCLFVPYEKPEDAQAIGHPWLFTGAVFALFFLVPLLYSTLFLDRIVDIYEQMGLEVWSRGFQGTLAGRAIDTSSEFAHWPVFVAFFGAVLAVLFALLFGAVYRTLCSAKVRRVYAITLMLLGALWSLFIVGGTLLPMLTMVGRV